MSTTSGPIAPGPRWWHVRGPFAVAPLIVLFAPIGWIVPGWVVGLILTLVGQQKDEVLIFEVLIVYVVWIGICARVLYSALRAKPVKHLQAAIWGGLSFGALLIPILVLFAIGISLVFSFLAGE